MFTGETYIAIPDFPISIKTSRPAVLFWSSQLRKWSPYTPRQKIWPSGRLGYDPTSFLLCRHWWTKSCTSVEDGEKPYVDDNFFTQFFVGDGNRQTPRYTKHGRSTVRWVNYGELRLFALLKIEDSQDSQLSGCFLGEARETNGSRFPEEFTESLLNLLNRTWIKKVKVWSIISRLQGYVSKWMVE